MTNRRQFLALAAVSGWAAVPAHASPAGQPYTVEVWSDATFGTDGTLQQLEVADTEKLPAPFVERVRKQLASARIPPVKDDSGAAASFSTGIRLVYLVTPGPQGGTVKLDGMQIAPRPLKRYAAAQPEQLPAGTPLSVKLRCEVGIDGRCAALKIVAATGTSDALRRWAVASLRGWEFAPQRINGQPVVGEAEVELVLNVPDDRPVDFRDPRRL
ncbi:MAG: energy transducer TonB [Rubrivivax sp.]|nr:energy transducer TonB [Rubrivivax sp.]